MNKLSKKQLLHNLDSTSRYLLESAQYYAAVRPPHNQHRNMHFDFYIFGHSNMMVQIIMQLMMKHNTGNS